MMSGMTHRMVTWDCDDVVGHGGIVCGITPTVTTMTSTLPSGYDCPDCIAQTPGRQTRALIASAISSSRTLGAPEETIRLLEQALLIWQCET